ncbi:MAG TPA: DNA repair protein RecN [Gemmatimonadales bacterium]
MTLVSLRVRDLATIADVTLDLGAGLNVLTGETGAGKSMLVDALALLLGDRADRAAIRPGAAKAIVEGVVEAIPAATRRRLDESGIDADESLIIRREVTSEGRSRAWINGSPTTVGVLASIGESLVDLHGQHQTIQLLDADMQRSLLDGFGQVESAAYAVRAAYDELAALRAQENDLTSRRNDAQRRADWLRHVVKEIDTARIRPGEEDDLIRDAARLGQASTLAEHTGQLLASIDDEESGARSGLDRAERALHPLERLDAETSAWRELLDSAYAALDELSNRAQDYLSGLAEDPGRLADLERRRDVLQDLRRKHGPSLTDVIAARDAAQAELDLLDTAEVDLRGITGRIRDADARFAAVAAELTTQRATAGARLAREVTRLLPRLGLTGGEFSVVLAAQPAPGSEGAELITFMVRLNRGMEPRPLARVASGGELSRLMLALKVVLARQDAVPTLVFDEIDQGVGGEVGTRVGESLARVAERHQVLIITHLPQIAARADRHLRIAKATRGGIATSDVSVLHGEDRVLELARMLGDPDGDAARRMALALLNARVSA